MEKQWKQWQTIFLGSKITADGDCSHEIKRCFLLGRKVMTILDSIFKSRDIANKGPFSQGYGFMWKLNCDDSWVLKNWCFWIVVFEKTLESPLDCKEIQSGHPKGNQSWIFIGRTDAEAEIPILWPPDVKNWLIRKEPDAGKDWRQEEMGTTEDAMVGWHHWLNGQEFEWAPGVGDGQGSWACCSPWGCKGSDTTERLNWTELNWRWQTSRSWLDLDPQLSTKWHAQRCHDSSKALSKDKFGWWPKSWKSPPLPKSSWNNSPTH